MLVLSFTVPSRYYNCCTDAEPVREFIDVLATEISSQIIITTAVQKLVLLIAAFFA
jgi:hypothetical protein